MTYSLSHMVIRRSGRVTERRGAVAIPLVTLLVVVALAFGAYRLGQLNRFICDGPCGAVYVEPPDALGLTVGQNAAAPTPTDAGPADPAKVRAAVSSALTSSLLGSHVGFVALDPETGATLSSMGSGGFTPASTAKILTAYAALASMDAGTRFATRVVWSNRKTIVLVGGGDPFLGSEKPKPALYAQRANLADLAIGTATALKKSGTKAVSLGFDDSLFTGPDVSANWESSYVSGNIVTPVSALWADEGVGSNGVRARDPGQSAAATFATLLRKQGIGVEATVARVIAPAGATEISGVSSAPLGQVLESMTQRSDNEAAEVMLRHIAIARGKPGTFTDGVAAVGELLSAGGIDTAGLVLYDGSGLSRDNRISPLTLAQTIRVASKSPRTASLVSELPVGGFNGSIFDRFQGAAAQAGRGVVHAKSGTLTGVHSMAGFVRAAGGGAIVFAIMADRTGTAPPLAVEGALDNVAAALAACRCRS